MTDQKTLKARDDSWKTSAHRVKATIYEGQVVKLAGDSNLSPTEGFRVGVARRHLLAGEEAEINPGENTPDVWMRR